MTAIAISNVGASPAASLKWFGKDRPEHAGRPALFCLPYAGGGASIYRGWSQLLPDFEVIPVRLPGREMRLNDRAHVALDDLVGELADAMAGQRERPFLLFGHSMGALIAHELVLELDRRGRRGPELLCVSARGTGDVPVDGAWQSAASLADDDFVDFLGTLSPATPGHLSDPSLRAMLLPMLRADFQLCCSPRTHPLAAVDVPVLALSGSTDPFVSHGDMARWREKTSASFVQAVVEGDHFFVTANPPAVTSLVDAAFRRRRESASRRPQPERAHATAI